MTKYDEWQVDEKYGWNIRYQTPVISFIRICPGITDGDTLHKPIVDIYWNKDTKQVDARYEGPISEAAKALCDLFAAQLWKYFKEHIEASANE